MMDDTMVYLFSEAYPLVGESVVNQYGKTVIRNNRT